MRVEKITVPDDVELVVQKTVEAAASLFGSTPSRVFSKSRRRTETAARKCACAALRRRGMSLHTIAYLFGIDHTSIVWMQQHAPADAVQQILDETESLPMQPWHLPRRVPKQKGRPPKMVSCPKCESQMVWTENVVDFVLFCAKCDHEWRKPLTEAEKAKVGVVA